MIGIYKITNPSKKIYIGQSANIERRFKDYKKSRCKSQTKLYLSFKKYGIVQHIFEVICECEISELNEKERYYQDLYSATERKSGLNLLLTKTETQKGCKSEETINKTRSSLLGKKLSEEHKKNIGLGNKGKVVSQETRIKMSISAKKTVRDAKKLVDWVKNHTYSKEERDAMRIRNIGKKHSAKTKNKMSESHRKLTRSQKHCDNISKGKTGRFRSNILNTITGTVYDSYIHAACELNLNINTLKSKVRSKKNKSLILIYKNK